MMKMNLHHDIHLKVNRPTLGLCFEITLVVENSIHKMRVHYDIHLKVNQLTLGFDIKIKLGVGSLIRTSL